MKILIIDNDPGMCQLMTMAFKHAKIDVVATGSLQEAEGYIFDDSIGALLMDYHLGGGESGFSVLKRFSDLGMKLPFWLVTGTPNDPGALQVKELPGCQGIVAKPFSIQELIKTVAPVLSSKPRS
ncbi:MAG: response regulator [Planctomycetota bacterium]|nr:response regulator [Planctomycetota bacterium]